MFKCCLKNIEVKTIIVNMQRMDLWQRPHIR